MQKNFNFSGWGGSRVSRGGVFEVQQRFRPSSIFPTFLFFRVRCRNENCYLIYNTFSPFSFVLSSRKPHMASLVESVPPPAKNEQASEYVTDPNGYVLHSKIGQGAFATVYLATLVSDNSKKVAIKILSLDSCGANLKDISREVQTMRLASHENVLTCYCSFVAGDKLWLIMELMEKGSCLHLLNRVREMGLGNGFREEVVTFILHQTLLGLKYFHESNGQIHRDVKAGNILLSSKGSVRIADFGVSGWLVNSGDRRQNTKTFVGTPCWMAPEVMEQMVGYDFKADIWSFGITALELARGNAPYAHFPPMKVLLLTIQEEPPSLATYDDACDQNYSKTFKDVIKLCLQKDPKKRPTCSQLLAHKHFKAYLDPEYVKSQQLFFKTNVLDLIDDIGKEGGKIGDNLTDDKNNSAAIMTAGEDGTVVGSNQTGAAHVTIMRTIEGSSDRPAGTTWVFSDGSQVLLSSAKEESEKDKKEGDFFDEFEKETGGENFKLEKEKKEMEEVVAQKGEIDDFFDEFEATTMGENADKVRTSTRSQGAL